MLFVVVIIMGRISTCIDYILDYSQSLVVFKAIIFFLKFIDLGQEALQLTRSHILNSWLVSNKKCPSQPCLLQSEQAGASQGGVSCNPREHFDGCLLLLKVHLYV